MAFFASRPDAVVEQLSDDEVEVDLLGSYNEDALRRAELEYVDLPVLAVCG